MITRLGQAVPHFLAGANFAGEGMRERLRTATFALFGLVTSIGLVLVGIAYNQGWPEFADSPIPGIPTERVGDASIAAEAAHGNAQSGNGGTSPGSAQARRTDFVNGRSPDRHSSSDQQLPVTVPNGQVPGPAPSGAGGVGANGSPTTAPAPQVPKPPVSTDLQLGQGAAPVAASPPASQTADVASVPGKGKGHEKAEKPEKDHGKQAEPPQDKPAGKPRGKPAPVTPTGPTPPSVPAPGSVTPQPPAAGGPGNGHGKGNAGGHDK